ncbi:heme oxygenase [Chryseobacterium sp. OSA05B]|uniref:heme oxygenase n=1 Tax=Chryseobacterium sp. OSA05B TaxID=2862650 RepID=UPI001CBCECAC|nr:heme oxygenase [Chryseobacterium sp. OSA05B]
MKTIHLFQFKDSVSLKIPFFKESHGLETLNELMEYDLMNTEKVTECIIETHDDFIFEDTSRDDLLKMCQNAEETVEHYFATAVGDDDIL